MTKQSRPIILTGLFIFILALDQLSKIWATMTFGDGQPARWYFGVLKLTYAVNPGGWGSLGANWSPGVRTFALLVVPAIVLLFLAIYALREKEMDWIQSAGYVIVVSGGLGNLIDRYRFQHVVDFLYIGYGPVGTNIFNVADMAVLLGIGFLIYGSWQEGKREALLKAQSGEEELGGEPELDAVP